MKLRLKKSYINSIWFFSIWPIFLFISQKALITIQFLNIRGHKYRKGSFLIVLFLFLGILVFSLLTLSFASTNAYSIPHFTSYILFLVYSILIAGILSSGYNSYNILKLITLLNFFGLILIHFVFFYEIELPGNRGLNFIRGTDNVVHRFFVETSPLFLISKFNLFKKRTLKLLFIGLTISYFFLISKNAYLSILFIILLIYNYYKSIKMKQFVFGLFTLLFMSVAGFIDWNSLIRADLLLSIFFKAEQFLTIINELSFQNIILGEGFGFFMNEFATDLNQPYQIEMQLPMLVLQLGLINCFVLITTMYFLFKSINIKYSFLTTGLFFSVGIINPWLFLPTWLITSIYFFR